MTMRGGHIGTTKVVNHLVLIKFIETVYSIIQLFIETEVYSLKQQDELFLIIYYLHWVIE